MPGVGLCHCFDVNALNAALTPKPCSKLNGRYCHMALGKNEPQLFPSFPDNCLFFSMEGLFSRTSYHGYMQKRDIDFNLFICFSAYNYENNSLVLSKY